jgi:hypothetical protein
MEPVLHAFVGWCFKFFAIALILLSAAHFTGRRHRRSQRGR